jgi:hypothetical protein
LDYAHLKKVALMKHESKMLLIMVLSLLSTVLLTIANTFSPGLYFYHLPAALFYSLLPLVVIAASMLVKFLDKRHYKKKDTVVVEK